MFVAPVQMDQASAAPDLGSVKQRTLKTAISCTGIALHSGAKATMTLKPAPVGTGILFRRIDIEGQGAEIAARFDNVVDTRLCTRIANADGVSVSTIEHLMAGLAGSGIDNAVIEINGPEVPVMDGSSAPFLFLIECAGTVEQAAPRKALKVMKRVVVQEGDKLVSLTPAVGFTLGFELDLSHVGLDSQYCDFAFSRAAFKTEIARARTFGFEHEVSALRAAGLAKGGSLDNAVVLSGAKVLNEDGLRYVDELVRHKVLDAVGDLYLAGAPLIGHFQGLRSNHGLNNKLLRKLFENAENYRLVDFGADAETEATFQEPARRIAVG